MMAATTSRLLCCISSRAPSGCITARAMAHCTAASEDSGGGTHVCIWQKLGGLERLAMDLAKARNLVVPLQQCGDAPAALDGPRIELPHRIEHGVIVRIEKVFLELCMSGDVDLRDPLRGHGVHVC